MSTSAQVPDFSSLRGFVTLVDLDELAANVDEAAVYFTTFSDDDDATLVVHAATPDAARAERTVLDVLAAAGADPASCADVRLCIVADDDGIWERCARHAHAVLGHGPDNWILVRRPTYRWDQPELLRDQAVRRWGVRDTGAPYSYEAAVAHVVATGATTERQVRMGSVPEESLATIIATLDAELSAPQPRLLHVGNFVGISLSYLLNWARTRNGFTVSVDPDLPHRGVERPQRVVCELLSHFGLSDRHLLVCGYSLQKCFSNDGVVFGDYDPAAAWAAETAPENVLPGLVTAGHRFDAVFVDGNHDGAYLRQELAEITRLIEPGGVLVLDDVDENWDQIRGLFHEVGNGGWPYEPVLADGRVGILRRAAGDHSRNRTEGR